MTGRPQHRKMADKIGTNTQRMFPNSQMTKPHLDGFVVMICQNPITQRATKITVTITKSPAAVIRHEFIALHSQAAVSQRPAMAWKIATHPVAQTAKENIGRSQGYSPVFEISPIHMAPIGSKIQITENAPIQASVTGSQWPLQQFWTGLLAQILSWAPAKVCFTNSPCGVSLRSMCKYQQEMAMRIVFTLTRCSVPPKASARCRTYSASSAAAGCSSFKRSKASLIISEVGIGQSPRLASTGPTCRGMLT
mmetsp:Transcript_14393/g.36277  ORF Transcript_14393/g.36277 Transcript_14393/m.36277 type:complete len:251 (+) Transcript_14393:195-947(+)